MRRLCMHPYMVYYIITLVNLVCRVCLVLSLLSIHKYSPITPRLSIIVRMQFWFSLHVRIQSRSLIGGHDSAHYET